jgi:hypothetical protein
MTRSLLLALLLGAAGPAAALPWDGTYRLSPDADCDRVGEEGGALRIAEGELTGVDSRCRMTDPVDVLDLDATLYVMECEGEGQEWTERAMLMDAAEGDGIFLLWRGYAFRYERCPAPDGAADEAAEGEDG